MDKKSEWKTKGGESYPRYHNCSVSNYSQGGGSDDSTFPSSMSFKVDENVYDGTWEGVLYGVDIEESESQKMKVGSKIDFEEDAESAKREDSRS